MNLIRLAEEGRIPDWLIRFGIRRLLAQRRRFIAPADAASRAAQMSDFVAQLRSAPVAVSTDAANEQHYEVPVEFFEHVLGPHLKYSCCHFDTPFTSLAAAEENALRQACRRAQIGNGMSVLELGCGWGSLTLWMARQFPGCRITAVSNSSRQRTSILSRARHRGLTNVRVITADMRDFAIDERFDRVLSIEMFEHMRNYELLFRRVSNWLTPEGLAFVHVFCHRETPYLFETEGASDWMGRNFFTGGLMPSEDLFAQFDGDLRIARQWRVSGSHYGRTCERWLQNLDWHHGAILARFCQDLPEREARQTIQRWRMFLLACAELFRYRGGSEWFVAHYLFRNKRLAATKEPMLLQHAG